tara:strand:- start:374 stop:1474 length:1101 start_codon:yes stop_codon:yes gene_type:complete
MNRLIITLFVLSSNIINAQDLDTLYLDTLTENEMNFSDSINLINQNNKMLVESRKAYNNGLSSMNANDLIKAVSYFTDAILIDSTFAMAYFNRANCYYKLKSKDPISDYQQSFYYDSLNYEALYQIANINREQEDINLAIDIYKRIISINPLEPKAYYELGNTYYHDKDILNAIESYTRSIDIKRDANVFNDRASCFRLLGEYAKANADYLSAIKLDSELAFVYNNLASVCRKQENLDDALHYYSLAVETDVNYFLAYNNRAGLYIEMGYFDKAMEDILRSIEINTDYAPAYNNRGIIYYKQDKYDIALIEFNKAIKLNNVYAKAYVNRGICKQMVRDEDGACNDWYTASKLGVTIVEKYLSNDCQ